MGDVGAGIPPTDPYCWMVVIHQKIRVLGLLKMLGQQKVYILPNGGELMVIYHGTIRKKILKNKSKVDLKSISLYFQHIFP